MKEQKVREALQFLGDFKLEKTVESEQQGFRNRVKMAVTGSVAHPILGLTGAQELDQGRELLSCPIHHPKLNELMKAMPHWIQKFNLIPYQISERKGELKGLIAFYSPHAEGPGQMLLRFILRSKECVLRIQKLLPDLQQAFPELVCVSANIQPIPHAILEGPEEIILTQQKTIAHEMGRRFGRFQLKLMPNAFVQTNAKVATELYETAATWIRDEFRALKMLELFCGQGAFSFFVARALKDGNGFLKENSEIRGAEINPDAVAIANETARELGFENIKFKVLDATKVDAEFFDFTPNLILANPPRRGLADGVKIIQHQRPRYFLYSSCSIESLAADLKILSGEYVLRKIQVFDLFPHTEHFETLVLLEQRNT